MKRMDLNTKRQLLADSLLGNTAGLRRYQRHRQRLTYPYQRIVNDPVSEKVYGIKKDGSQQLLTDEVLADAPPGIVFTVIDFSGGKRIPEIDEELS